MRTYQFSLALIFATFVLLVIGGTVNPTGASLSCPDWPLCYGVLMPGAEDITNPDMVDKVPFEHTHRMAAMLVGVMTCVLAVLIWKTREKKMRLLGLAAVFMVIIQGVLGGLTVLWKLPTAISSAHLALSMFFFAFLIYLSFRLWPGNTSAFASDESAALDLPRTLALGAGILVFFQIFLGALLRHTGAGAICGPAIPWCGENLWPSFGLGQLHMTHRYMALPVLLVSLAASWMSWKSVKSPAPRHGWRGEFHGISKSMKFGENSKTTLFESSSVKKPTDGLFQHPAKNRHSTLVEMAALAVPVLVITQIVLGFLTVTTSVGVIPVTAHLGVGALLWAGFVVIFFALDSPVDRIGESS